MRRIYEVLSVMTVTAVANAAYAAKTPSTNPIENRVQAFQNHYLAVGSTLFCSMCPNVREEMHVIDNLPFQVLTIYLIRLLARSMPAVQDDPAIHAGCALTMVFAFGAIACLCKFLEAVGRSEVIDHFDRDYDSDYAIPRLG